MMLHEAVMLEIYRQALSASELVSPRCQSRESNTSGVASGDVRCPSNDSVYSTHDAIATAGGATTPTTSTTPAPSNSTPIATQIELPIPGTLPPATLLPTQSAAMAAYLSAANHLFLANPLAASLVHASPARHLLNTEDTALDFSVKSDVPRQSDEEEEEDDEHTADLTENNEDREVNDLVTPLDLSCSGRKRPSSEKDGIPSSSTRKMACLNNFKTWATPSINPYLAAVAAVGLSPKINNDWKKAPTNEAAKALERMTEMTRLGVEKSETPLKPQVSTPSPTPSAQTNGGSGGRHSAWQSHWLNKGAHSVKDVFKCVWCKQSFPTLASLTTHMKETKHCGVNMPPTSNAAIVSNVPTSASVTVSHSPTSHSNSNSNNNNKKSDLNLLIKETMPLPRKLVRGQDVWLGKGAEQTRQILKCMWCGQSFRSLAEMTSHMQETQHYTNIISQEQIISWKSSDDKTVNGTTSPNSTTSSISNNPTTCNTGSSVGTSNTVSAVLTCKVCDQAFPSLKELSNHMVKNSHYKEPIIRQTSESPSLGLPRRGRQMREKRKKSLPVRKLLEMERAGGDYSKCTNNSLDPALKPLRDFAASTKITCEKCGDKIETALFVEHIRQCLGGMLLNTPRSTHISQQTENRKTSNDNRQISSMNSSQSADILTPTKEGEKSNSLPSVLNAIEQLIEKSFDLRPPRVYGGNATNTTPLGASILKRLGIDDNVDYTKPLMDVHAMRFRSSSSYSSLRDRSASESSSISERCGSSFLEAATPERAQDLSGHVTPRLQTPEKLLTPRNLSPNNNNIDKEMNIKTEPLSEGEKSSIPILQQKIKVKKEFNEVQNTDGEITKFENFPEEINQKLSTTPHTTTNSPNGSERSGTPTSLNSEKKLSGGSLNALSSMFNSLNNTLSFSDETNNNNTNNNNININNHNNNKSKKSNANPLAALQKLCETTDPPAANTRSNITNTTGGVASGMLGFGWDAETMTKCAYCDTTFYTKGAYRHHLQKVHFIKGGEEVSVEQEKSPKSAINSPSSASKSPATMRQVLSPTLNTPTLPTINPYDESPQSKFRKYSELAKQLSSKNN